LAPAWHQCQKDFAHLGCWRIGADALPADAIQLHTTAGTVPLAAKIKTPEALYFPMGVRALEVLNCEISFWQRRLLD
jgi:hypothetical protein